METNVVQIDTQDQPEGTVLAQESGSGEEVPEGTLVTLQVVGPASDDRRSRRQRSGPAIPRRDTRSQLPVDQQEASDTVAVGQ